MYMGNRRVKVLSSQLGMRTPVPTDHNLYNFNERFRMTVMFYTIVIILLMIVVRLIK